MQLTTEVYCSKCHRRIISGQGFVFFKIPGQRRLPVFPLPVSGHRLLGKLSEGTQMRVSRKGR